MVKRIIITCSSILMLLPLISFDAQAQNTNSATNQSAGQSATNTQQSAGGPIRRLRKKIRSMRPRIRRRQARKNANNSNSSADKKQSQSGQ